MHHTTNDSHLTLDRTTPFVHAVTHQHSVALDSTHDPSTESTCLLTGSHLCSTPRCIMSSTRHFRLFGLLALSLVLAAWLAPTSASPPSGNPNGGSSSSSSSSYVPCSSVTYGSFVVDSSLNLAIALQTLMGFAAQNDSDVLTSVLLQSDGGGSLTFYDVVDSPIDAWCYDTVQGLCSGPQGFSTLAAVADPGPDGGWPGNTGSYPFNALAYRIATSATNTSTSLAEYLPVFASAELSRTIELPADMPAGAQLYLAGLDWDNSNDRGAVHVMVQYSQHCPTNESFSSSGGSVLSASVTAGIVLGGVVVAAVLLGLCSLVALATRRVQASKQADQVMPHAMTSTHSSVVQYSQSGHTISSGGEVQWKPVSRVGGDPQETMDIAIA